MARHQQQQRAGHASADPVVRVQGRGLLALVGARGDPRRTPREVRIPETLPGLDQSAGKRKVRLEVAGDQHMLGVCAHPQEAGGVLLALRRDQDAVGERLAEQAAEALVALHRAWRDAGVGEHQRYAAFAALAIHVRPELGLHDDRQARPHAPEKTAHRARGVVGRVAVQHLVTEQVPDLLRAGGRHGGHDDGNIRVFLAQRGHQRGGGDHFSHGHGVHPDPRPVEPAPAEAETLFEMLPVGAVRQPFPEQDQGHHGDQQIGDDDV